MAAAGSVMVAPGSGWTVKHLSAFDSPAFTGEDVPDWLLELLVSKLWVEERERRWGKTNPLYVSKVLGQFPEAGDYNLIQPAWVRNAQNIELAGNQFDVVVSVDVARFGEDETVVYRRDGHKCYRVMSGNGWATTVTAGRIQKYAMESVHPFRLAIDDVGVGGGVFDILAENGLSPVGVNGGARCSKMMKNGVPQYVNLRSELFWNLRQLLEAGQLSLDSEDEDLAAQLVDIRWGVNSKGQIWVETKEDMKKRGVSSPDRADALAYLFADSIVQTEVRKTAVKDKRLKGRR